MTAARLLVEYAGPLTTVQDRGRFGHQRFGVTESGPMDRTAFAIGQSILGNDPTGSAIEVGLGGLDLRCTEGSVFVTVCGGGFSVKIDGEPRHSWVASPLEKGSTLSLRPGRWGSWSYVAFAGDIDRPAWLGSIATNPALHFTGRPLLKDDEIVIKRIRRVTNSGCDLPIPVFCRPRNPTGVVAGPQERYFSAESLDRLLSEPYLLTTDFDRMGVRLDGPKLAITAELVMPSEGILRGSLQVPGGGDPVVLMADHQTTGGYPKIATVISADQDGFAQLRPRQEVWFQAVAVEHAIARARTRQAALRTYLEALARITGRPA